MRSAVWGHWCRSSSKESSAQDSWMDVFTETENRFPDRPFKRIYPNCLHKTLDIDGETPPWLYSWFIDSISLLLKFLWSWDELMKCRTSDGNIFIKLSRWVWNREQWFLAMIMWLAAHRIIPNIPIRLSRYKYRSTKPTLPPPDLNSQVRN